MVPNLPWVEDSSGPLAFPVGAWGLEWGRGGSCISMRRLRLLFLLVAGDGWGTEKGPKKSTFRFHEKGSFQTLTLQRNFFSRRQAFNEPVSPLCLVLPSACCRSLAPFLSLSILPLPFAPDLLGNFLTEESPKGRWGKERWQQCRRKEGEKEQPIPGSSNKKGL